MWVIEFRKLRKDKVHIWSSMHEYEFDRTGFGYGVSGGGSGGGNNNDNSSNNNRVWLQLL